MLPPFVGKMPITGFLLSNAQSNHFVGTFEVTLWSTHFNKNACLLALLILPPPPPTSLNLLQSCCVRWYPVSRIFPPLIESPSSRKEGNIRRWKYDFRITKDNNFILNLIHLLLS